MDTSVTDQDLIDRINGWIDRRGISDDPTAALLRHVTWRLASCPTTKHHQAVAQMARLARQMIACIEGIEDADGSNRATDSIDIVRALRAVP